MSHLRCYGCGAIYDENRERPCGCVARSEASTTPPVAAVTDAVKPLTREKVDELATAFEEMGYAVQVTGKLLRELVATAKAGMADTERLDWIEATVVKEGETPPAEFDEAARVWRHDDGRTFASFRDVLDALMSETGPTCSGQASPDQTEKA